MRIPKSINPVMIIAGLFAITLQIHTTVFKSDIYEGLRVSAADLLLPATGLLIAASIFLKHSIWPYWKKPFGWWAPALLTTIMTMAMVNGYLSQGEINEWAFINKFFGWLVIVAYFCAGAWFATNYNRDFIKAFLKMFFIFFMVIIFGEIYIQIFWIGNIQIIAMPYWRSFEGLMDNRNAFAFLFVNIITFFIIYQAKAPPRLLYLFWILVPLIILFNASRTLWLCMGPLLLFCSVYDWRKTVKIVIPCLTIGTLVFFTLFSERQQQFFASLPVSAMKNLVQYTQTPADEDIQRIAGNTGNKQRIDIITQAITMIKQRPLIGSGLGSVIYEQEQQLGRRNNIIDNTILWLLVETGAIGLTAFLACYVAMGLALALNISNFRSPDNHFILWAFLMLFTFGIFSLTHEILYTRFFWFILGMALVQSKINSSNRRLAEPTP